MEHETLFFALIAVACYLLAFLTSHVLVCRVLPEHQTAKLGKGARYVAIDGIRGYLAFGVYVHHCMVTWVYMSTGHWTPASHNFENELGKTSVAIFFMITAFLFWGRAHAKREIEWKSFFMNRFFRIYPLYLFVVIVICVAVAYKSDWIALEPTASIAKNIAKWLFFRDPDINRYAGTTLVVAGVTWTLLYEAWFYVSLPLLVIVFLQRHDLWKKLVAVAVVAVLFRLNHLEIAVTATFIGGIMAVYWRTDARRVNLTQRKFAAPLALACISGVLLFLYEPFNPAGIALLTIFFVIIASGNTLFGLLKTRAALWLGEVSYSIYLCHGIILWIVLQNILPRFWPFHPTKAWLAASAIGITPIVILCCSATYLFVERPLIDLGHRISKGKSAVRVA